MDYDHELRRWCVEQAVELQSIAVHAGVACKAIVEIAAQLESYVRDGLAKSQVN